MKRSKKHRKRHLLPGPAGILQQRNDSSSELGTKSNALASQTRMELNGHTSLPDNDGRNKKSKSNLTHTQIWDAMCVSMDRIVPVGHSGRHSSSNLEILRRAVSPDYSLLVEVANSQEMKIKKIIVQIEAVHSHGHYDYTVELADESTRLLSSSFLRHDSSVVTSASSIPIGWLSQSLIQMHPEWIKPGTVMLCHNVSLAVFRSNKGLIDRMILLGEDNVIYAWTEDSFNTPFGDQGKLLDDDKYLRLLERRAEVEERLKMASLKDGISDGGISSDSEDEAYDSSNEEVQVAGNKDFFTTDGCLQMNDAIYASHKQKLQSKIQNEGATQPQHHEEMNRDQMLNLFADSESTCKEGRTSTRETQRFPTQDGKCQQLPSIQNPYHRSDHVLGHIEYSQRNNSSEINNISIQSINKVADPYVKTQNRTVVSQTDVAYTSKPFIPNEIRPPLSALKNANEDILATGVDPNDNDHLNSHIIVTNTTTTSIQDVRELDESCKDPSSSYILHSSLVSPGKRISPRDVSSNWKSMADITDDKNAFDEEVDIQGKFFSNDFISPNQAIQKLPKSDFLQVDSNISDSSGARVIHGFLFSDVQNIADNEMDAFAEDD